MYVYESELFADLNNNLKSFENRRGFKFFKVCECHFTAGLRLLGIKFQTLRVEVEDSVKW